jgi:hypothetical protein
MTYAELFSRPIRPGTLYALTAIARDGELHFKVGVTDQPHAERLKQHKGRWSKYFRLSPLISFPDPDAWRKERFVHMRLAPDRTRDPDNPGNNRVNWEFYRLAPEQGLRRLRDILAEYDRRLSEYPDQPPLFAS